MARFGGIGRGPRNRVGCIILYVENVVALANQAIAAGAKVLMPVQDQFWRDRYAKLADPFGHVWDIATHKEDVAPEKSTSAPLPPLANRRTALAPVLRTCSRRARPSRERVSAHASRCAPSCDPFLMGFVR